jgi:hypothetical protein
MTIVLLSEAAEARAHELRKRSYILNQLGGFDEADALRAKAAELERRAERARPQFVSRVVVPIKSCSSFAIDPQGAA